MLLSVKTLRDYLPGLTQQNTNRVSFVVPLKSLLSNLLTNMLGAYSRAVNLKNQASSWYNVWMTLYMVLTKMILLSTLLSRHMTHSWCLLYSGLNPWILTSKICHSLLVCILRYIIIVHALNMRGTLHASLLKYTLITYLSSLRAALTQTRPVGQRARSASSMNSSSISTPAIRRATSWKCASRATTRTPRVTFCDYVKYSRQ